MRQHEQRSDQATEKPQRANLSQESAALGGPLSPAAVLGLQRLVGNAAVVQRLAGHEHVDGCCGSGAAVQRTAVHQALGSSGRPLDEDVRSEMEGQLGADFSDVRVHTDPTAHAAAESVQAHAFTSGSHIVFQRGRYDTASSAGKRMLAHELTHVVQQRSGPVAGTDAGDGLKVSDPSDAFERAAEANADRVMAEPVQRHSDQTVPPAAGQPPAADVEGTAIQRDVGFEVEIPGASTSALAPPLKPAERSGDKRVVTPITSMQWSRRRADRPWWRPQIDPPSMARRLAKKERLVDVPGSFTVEADDAIGGNSDLEFVTAPFPEGEAGRQQLADAIAGMMRVAQLINGQFRTASELAAAASGTAQAPTNAPADYASAEYVVLGFANSGNPQVTAGIPLENLQGLFSAVQTAYDERNDPDQAVSAAAPDLAFQDSIPDGAGGRTGAIREAKQHVDRVLNQHASVSTAASDESVGEPAGNESVGTAASVKSVDTPASVKSVGTAASVKSVDTPASDKLRGLLLLVAAYLINGAAKPNEAYYKGIAPVMARTDFASMFALLDPAERTRLAADNGDPFVQLALQCANLTAPGAAGGPVLGSVQGDTPAQRVQFTEVTRQAWLRGITQGIDLLSRQGYATSFPAQAQKGEHFESMGSLGARTDTSQGRPAPIVELRRMRNNLPSAEWAPVLLGVFDLITDIVERGNNNPRYRRA